MALFIRAKLRVSLALSLSRSIFFCLRVDHFLFVSLSGLRLFKLFSHVAVFGLSSHDTGLHTDEIARCNSTW